MGKRNYYLTIDTETATLPFADSICKDARQKQKIAIAKPLVYDIGWVISDTQGNIYKKVNYLVQETFFVPNVFNTAYYKDKRNLYLAKLAKGEIKVDVWDNIINALLQDLQGIKMSTAFNACFDFKKAIPFTEQYMKYLYSDKYNQWESWQRKQCEKILNGTDETENAEYLEPYFELRGQRFDIIDLWGLACDRLINIPRYKSYCLDNKLVTNSAVYFKTSAEVVFQYLANDYDFVEEHTALADSEIESFILAKALKKGKIEPSLKAFPFRDLGTTVDFAIQKQKYVDTVYDLLYQYFDDNEGYDKQHLGYWVQIANLMARLENVRI